jgi:hypothetical protein
VARNSFTEFYETVFESPDMPEDTAPSISSAPTRCSLLKLGTADIFFWQDRSVEEEERNQQYNIIT